MSLIAALKTETAGASQWRPATDYANALREDGLAVGTMVQTPYGMQRIEALQPGDLVMTFDNGPQPIAAIHSTTIAGASLPRHKAFVMQVPAEALGNNRPVRMLPNQEVLIESDIAEEVTGDPFVLIPAVLLGGYRRLETEALAKDFKVIMLTFQNEQILQVEGGLWVACRAEADFSPFEVALTAAELGVYPRPDPMMLEVLAEAIVEAQDRTQ